MSDFALTSNELACLSDTKFLQTKVAIQTKTDRLLSATHHKLKEYIQNSLPTFPEAVLVRGGKISRGENYRNLPYFVLDYPRRLSTDDIFNLRTMIWWGHELSITWHLSGHSLEQYRSQLSAQLSLIKKWSWFICIGEDPWQYNRHPEYYQPSANFEEMEWNNWLKQRAFCKFAVFFSLTQWNALPDEAVIFLDRVVTLLDL